MMNIQKMMKQAQQMQQKIADMQEELHNKDFEGSAGGGMVRVVINGKGVMRKIALDDSLIDKQEKEMLEDLIIAAFNEAKKKADDATNAAMSDATSGMNLPAGMKLPF
jgi:nucleoid-associated protein EbfC